MSSIGNAKILYVCTDCDYSRIIYHGIKKQLPIAQIITERPVSKKLLVKRRIKKLGLITVVGQLIFQGLVVPVLRITSAKRVSKIVSDRKLDRSPIPVDRILTVDSVNDPAFINAVERIQPSLIIVNGTRIISRDTLSMIRCPLINVHVGITPLYRGVHGAYWALALKDKENCGVTIHLVDKGIDTGGIIVQEKITITKADNFITYPYLQFEKAVEMLNNIVPEILQNRLSLLEPPEGVSKLWYHPTIWQYFRNRIKGVR